MSLLPQIKKRGTLTENTYEVLREAIINLDLKPGQPLLEEEIGRQLGVSRTPAGPRRTGGYCPGAGILCE